MWFLNANLRAKPAMLVAPVMLCVAASAHAQAPSLPPSVHSRLAAPFDAFGADLALWSSIYCAVGVRGADGAAMNTGAIDTFDLKEGLWTYRQRLAPVGLAAGDQFGHALAATPEWLAASATRHDASGTDSGAVWVYRRDGLSWTSPQKLIPGMGSDGARFGTSVALGGTAGSERLVIGAPGTTPGGPTGGSVAMYRLVDGNWVLESTVVNPTPANGDRFGEAVAIEGTRLLVSDPFDDTIVGDRGAVYAYELVGSAWTLRATLVPAVNTDRQYYGRSIAVKGTRLAIGAYGADSGDAAISSCGAVELYDLVGDNWSRSAELRPTTPVVGGNFGWDVAIEGNVLVVGEPGYTVPGATGERHGRTSVYMREPSSQWVKVAEFVPSEAQAEELFGTSVALLGGKLAVGAPGCDGRAGALLAANIAADCDANLVLDIQQISEDSSLDCNGDMLLDTCQGDANGDGVPNFCDCPGDSTGDGAVSSADLSFILAEWGNYGGNPADLNGDLVVDAQDLSLCLVNWGPCK